MMKTQMVCLGLSRKQYNLCIAGYDIHNKKTIRPVTNSSIRCIAPSLCTLDNGKQLEVLDIVEIPLTQHCPVGCQTENYSIDQSAKWKYIGSFDKTQLATLTDTPDILWYNGDSSYYGFNDRMPTEIAESMFAQSIYFLQLNHLDLIVQYEGTLTQYTPKKVRGHFIHNDVKYTLSVTDCAIEPKLKTKECGKYTIQGPLFAGISLSEDFYGYRYKLLASIIQLN